MAVSECTSISLLLGAFFPSTLFTLMDMAPSPRPASDKAAGSRDSRAEPLIRQLQRDLLPRWAGLVLIKWACA